MWFSVTFILSKGNLFNIFVLCQCIVYWINFQDIYTGYIYTSIYTSTYRKFHLRYFQRYNCAEIKFCNISKLKRIWCWRFFYLLLIYFNDNDKSRKHSQPKLSSINNVSVTKALFNKFLRKVSKIKPRKK